LCKTYGIFVDDPVFDELNNAQLAWYQMQFIIDDKEQFELLRGVAEHNAMFMNPEGVQQVRDARENSFSTSDDEFDQLLEDTFGRESPIDKTESEKSVVDVVDEIRQVSKYNQVVDMDLDKIKFTPFK
jgi:hypothetical protein